MHTLSAVKMVLSPFRKGSILKGNNLLSLAANSLPLEKNPFQKGLTVQESN